MDDFTGTQAMTAQHAVDVAALQAWLSTHLPDFEGPLRIEQFKGGQSNPTLNCSMRSGPSKPGRWVVSQACKTAAFTACWAVMAWVPVKSSMCAVPAQCGWASKGPLSARTG